MFPRLLAFTKLYFHSMRKSVWTTFLEDRARRCKALGELRPEKSRSSTLAFCEASSGRIDQLMKLTNPALSLNRINHCQLCVRQSGFGKLMLS